MLGLYFLRGVQPLYLGILLILVSVVMSGCAVDSQRIVPTSVPPAAWRTDSSLRVAEVRTTVPKATFFSGSTTVVENDQFRSALISTLKKSGFFVDVSRDSGDLELQATITTQKAKELDRPGLLDFTWVMTVDYKFLDKSNKAVWSATIESESSSAAFAGSTRLIESIEGAARENLSALLKGINEQWPRNSTREVK